MAIKMAPKQKFRWICLILVLLTTAVFLQVTGFEFVSLDDATYVSENPNVRDGLSRTGIIWAFTTSDTGYWRPVAWIAHMVNCQLFGINAKAHHAMNLLIHIANTLLLFGFLRQTTGSKWKSGFVAALFAIHPLHVESVAWIAELKDVLSTFFWLLTVLAFVHYAENGRLKTYLLALLIYAVGLMTKPMLVSLPVILLLIDYWPLGRLTIPEKKRSLKWLIAEKIPFFLFAGLSSLATYISSKAADMVIPVEKIAIEMRVKISLLGYTDYLKKTIWPDPLACIYPFTPNPPAWQIASAGVVLLVAFILVIRLGKKHGYGVTGLLWYFIMLLPAIGLIQFGSQQVADRYTYLPLVGLFIMAAWGVPDLVNSVSARALRFLPFLAGSIIIAFAVRAWFQVRTWENGVTLFQHTIRVTKDNYVAHNNLGILFADQGRLDEAIAQYQEALKIRPNFAVTQNNLANALMQKDQMDKAILHFNEALRLDPDYAEAQNNMGIAMAKQGRFDEAIDYIMTSLKANPDNIGRQKNLLRAIGKLRDKEKAATYYRAALDVAETANQQELADAIREKWSHP